ncbi:hypothetical protein AA0242T_2413 [Acetobacter aceti NRIC 0242]|nr:hypothetical protein AA0242T_2413 [Acetobacter aceti NRIC 0242]
MRQVLPGDIVFSYAKGLIQQIGIATHPAVTAPKPGEFGVAGAQWHHDGWMIPVKWHALPHAFSPKSHIRDLAPLLPEKYSPISPESGNGNQGAYLAGISEELGQRLLSYQMPAWSRDVLALSQGMDDDDGALRTLDDAIAQSINNDVNLNDTERLAQVQSRRGQGRFRLNVEEIETGCRVSQVTDKRHLKASHIKPWRACETGNERLDGHNGFLLSPNIDHLFDHGYITFTNNGRVKVSPVVDCTQLMFLGCVDEMPVRGAPFTERQQEYLAYHFANVFIPG